MKQGIVIGAGIGGLTTAAALARKGIAATVFEQASELNEVGAGIWVAPNGLQVYQKLGLADGIISLGKMLDKITVADIKGEPISVVDGEYLESKYGFKTLSIHRALLQNFLADEIPADRIVLGKKFLSYAQTDSKVIAEFDDGTSASADFLIVADGIRSNGRLQINDSATIRYSGQTCWRFVTDFELPAGQLSEMNEIWGDERGLRVGYSMINSRQAYVYITNYENAGGKDDVQTLKEYLLNICKDFPAVVAEMISVVKAEGIIRTDLYDLKPIPNWVDKKVALLGDAAHATTPNLGQGACQAIEDAYVISEQLAANENIEIGMRKYQQARLKKAAFITNTAWRFAKVTNTSGWKRSLLKTLIRMTPTSINERMMHRIYSVE